MCQRICLKKLEEYDWPGNVRELEHVIVYGMSMVDETSALLQYKDIKGKLLLEKQADREKRRRKAWKKFQNSARRFVRRWLPMRKN